MSDMDDEFMEDDENYDLVRVRLSCGCVCASRCACCFPVGVHVGGGGLRAGRGPGEPVLPVKGAQGDQPARRHRQLREGA